MGTIFAPAQKLEYLLQLDLINSIPPVKDREIFGKYALNQWKPIQGRLSNGEICKLIVKRLAE
jgi:hypothetical protein